MAKTCHKHVPQPFLDDHSKGVRNAALFHNLTILQVAVIRAMLYRFARANLPKCDVNHATENFLFLLFAKLFARHGITSTNCHLELAKSTSYLKEKIDGNRFFIDAILHKINRVINQCENQELRTVAIYNQMELKILNLKQQFTDEIVRTNYTVIR